MIEVLNPLTMSDWMRLQVTRSRKVGNALKGGGLHFHTGSYTNKEGQKVLCQCPEWGDLHFHGLHTIYGHHMKNGCQCPEWGDLHFHKADARLNPKRKGIVSMP